MDIGDVNEIPTTRRKLPSLQELGAFDVEPSTVTRRPSSAAQPPLPAPPPAPSPPPTAPQAARTPRAAPAARLPVSDERIRQALAKADPLTRKRLLRLIAGGRTVLQRGEQGPQPPGRTTASLSMAMPRAERPATASAAASSAGHRPQQESARAAPPPTAGATPRASHPADSDEPLLRIDARTDLLDAVAPALDAEQKKAALIAQLAAARNEPAPSTPRSTAHKVLFPAYDPREHGDDVRRPGRKPDAPVEGHFPAPRQPFQPAYRHADGREMDEQEARVEAVLQEQRCERTLEVLARDGVNGLLLSPRDLDAAVEDGVLDAETADTLWKTWSALRPVIHVIEDPPAPPQAADGTADAADSEPPSEALVESEPAAEPPVSDAAAVADTAIPIVTAEDTPAAPPLSAPIASPAVAIATSNAVGSADTPPMMPLESAAPLPMKALPAVTESSAQPLSPSQPASPPAAVSANIQPIAAAAAIDTAPPRWPRVVRGARFVGRIFVYGCVISSSVQVAWWAWRHGAFWLLR
ncbi:hypothetical protein [Piscinibacter sakaiensis]|uniref:hypothetical protein n=1 Tax=Piscinibacter sakaiensis TaxID=1547922 RepID=UPI003AAE46F0